METIKKLLAISPSQQLYIITHQLFSKTLGWETDVDDRKLPLEKLVQVLATLPKDVSDLFSSKVITVFWNDLEHPTRYWPAHSFRSADGSNNSHIYPHMGASNTSYARSVVSTFRRDRSEFPDPDELFEDLMKRPEGKFEPHPTGINSLLFCLAGVITHDLFRSDPANPTINLTTHYADLSVLYGVNKEEQDYIRTHKNGLIRPDGFADPRLQFQLPGIVALLILFSRNHNYIARHLLEETVNEKQENYRFTYVDGKDSVKLSDKRTDELVFQTARLINCACYANLILHEYVRTILGISTDSEFTLNPLMTPPPPNPTSGNVISLEFSYVYRWHGALSKESVKWMKDYPIIEKYMTLKKKLQEKSDDEEERRKYENMSDVEKDAYMRKKRKDDRDMFLELLKEFGYTKEEIHLGPVCLGYHRDSNTKAFKNEDIIKILKENMKSVASKMGAQKIPASLKDVETQGIRAARKVGLCTLNEFRHFFRLKGYKSYEEMLTGSGQTPDPHVVKALKKHYGCNGIDKVELYPGIVIEATKNDGLSLSYTTSRAILADAVNLLRNDRFYTDGLNPHDLTLWGYKYANDPPNGTTRTSIFKKMVESVFPEWDKADKLLLSPFKIPEVKTI